MCFVCHATRTEFIAADAMAKLRQKNPGTVRTPEEDRGRDNYTMDHWVLLDRSSAISRHIKGLCAEAAQATFARAEDVRFWASLPGKYHKSIINPLTHSLGHYLILTRN